MHICNVYKETPAKEITSSVGSLATSNIDKDEVPKFPNYATIRQQFEKPNENGQQLANPTTVNIY